MPPASEKPELRKLPTSTSDVTDPTLHQHPLSSSSYFAVLLLLQTRKASNKFWLSFVIELTLVKIGPGSR
jgi:hypothetical protein